MNRRLSPKEKTLVAVGASVAAGCIPCTQYHLKEGQAAGVTTEEMTGTIETALNVKARTGRVMKQIAYEALACPQDEASLGVVNAVDRLTGLVAIAAAVAVNCPTSFCAQVRAGRAVGVRDEEIRLVMGLAKMIRGKAVEKMDLAGREYSSPTAPVPTETGCQPPISQEQIPQSEDAAGGCCESAVSRTTPPTARQGNDSCC